MGVYKIASEFIRDGMVKVISKSENKIIVEVNGKTVIISKKKGYTIDSCSCTHHSTFCKLNPRCSHKLAVNTYLVMRGIE